MSAVVTRYAWWASPRQSAVFILTLISFLVAQLVAQGHVSLGSRAEWVWEGLGVFAAFGLFTASFMLLGKGLMRMAALARAETAHLLPDFRRRMRDGVWGWAALALLAAGLAAATLPSGTARLGLVFVAVTCCVGIFPSSLDQMLRTVRGRGYDRHGMWIAIPVVMLQYVPGAWGITLQVAGTVVLLVWVFRTLTTRPEPFSDGFRQAAGRVRMQSSRVGVLRDSFVISAAVVLACMLIHRGVTASQPFLAYFTMTSFLLLDPRGADTALLRLRWLAGASRMQLLGLGFGAASRNGLADTFAMGLLLAIIASFGGLEWREAMGLVCQFALLRCAFLFSGLCWVGGRLSYGWICARIGFHLAVVLALFMLHDAWQTALGDEYLAAMAVAASALVMHAAAFAAVGVWRWRRLEL
ncbi:hypothetical protein [Uliginosibacterium sp. H1]|uniref:hypothetical protein n=1 Tax=Uliginosibacterium sp. H1 TaxID=3114757 RepID=UPI002E18A68D|nr:hypothetical protein [Uliginosibacterium sp. H1]